MRIMLVSGSFPPMKCGVGDYTQRLATTLATLGVTVGVMTSAAADGGADQAIEVLPVVDGWRMVERSMITARIQDWRPDIVHVQYPTAGYGTGYLPWLLPAFLWAHGFKVVQTWHEHYPTGSKRSFANALVPGGLVLIRPGHEQILPDWCRRLHRPIRCIPNASVIPQIRLSEAERAAVKRRFAENKMLLAFFGFARPSKGVETLFEVADPELHHIVLICDLEQPDPYHESLRARVERSPWAGKVTVTGFAPPQEVARILSAADAVILPFRDGGGTWNTSLQAAHAQGTFVLTTSRERAGYDCLANVCYAKPGNVADMREALKCYIGRRRQQDLFASDCWLVIAQNHLTIYRQVLGEHSPTISDGS